jgi:cyclohexa-1,5-dienecarbonyl-CoA hydratase
MSTSLESKLARLQLDLRSAVARIGLRNPPLNVIDIPMMMELAEALAEIEAQPRISVVVISGESQTFSAGVDVAAHAPDQVQDMLTKFHAVIRALVSTRKVTIAAVHGHCLGGAAELAMVCDFVYTSDSAQWGFPEIKLGCYPPVACTALAALVGQKRAVELILTGKTISGIEAAAMGLATRSVSHENLANAVDQGLDDLFTLSPIALAVTKKAVYAWDAIHCDKGVARAEKFYLDELMMTADAREGTRAFVEKRAPKWTGK